MTGAETRLGWPVGVSLGVWGFVRKYLGLGARAVSARVIGAAGAYRGALGSGNPTGRLGDGLLAFLSVQGVLCANNWPSALGCNRRACSGRLARIGARWAAVTRPAYWEATC